MLERRRHLVTMLRAEKKRRHLALTSMRPRLEQHSAWLGQALEGGLGQRAADEPPLAGTGAAAAQGAGSRSDPGARILALTLLAELPELGTQQQLAALVGVAPLHRDRGLVSGKRLIWGGRARVRAALFMRSLAAVRYTRVLHASWVRLRERGKPKTVALVACRHKLLTILNAMFKQPWQPRLAA